MINQLTHGNSGSTGHIASRLHRSATYPINPRDYVLTNTYVQGVVAPWLRSPTLNREVFGTGLGCQCDAVSLGKALHLYVYSLDSGVNGYLVGQRWLVCLNM